jgi:hypothetical protein
VHSGEISNDAWFLLMANEPVLFINFQGPRHFDVIFEYTYIDSQSKKSPYTLTTLYQEDDLKS